MIGVLISNLGTPNAPTPEGVREFLSEFLSDRRVVNLPVFFWKPLLHGIILPLRSPRVAKLYQKIWWKEGSPLKVISQRQVKKLQQMLDEKFPDTYKVILGMRYGRPSIKNALNEFKVLKIKKLIVLPLYPQYSTTTTESTFDAVKDALTLWEESPDTHYITQYAEHPDYIDALCQRIRAHLNDHPSVQKLLFSFHSLPQKVIAQGDPYQAQCYQTSALVREKLNLPPDMLETVFQSRFGYAKWLQPDCAETLKTLPTKGITHVSVMCPGFSADCLETLEEIALRNREVFIAAGGKGYHCFPALNDSDNHIKMIAHLLGYHH